MHIYIHIYTTFRVNFFIKFDTLYIKRCQQINNSYIQCNLNENLPNYFPLQPKKSKYIYIYIKKRKNVFGKDVLILWFMKNINLLIIHNPTIR